MPTPADTILSSSPSRLLPPSLLTLSRSRTVKVISFQIQIFNLILIFVLNPLPDKRLLSVASTVAF
jgi:hypothetical protein